MYERLEPAEPQSYMQCDVCGQVAGEDVDTYIYRIGNQKMCRRCADDWFEEFLERRRIGNNYEYDE